MFRYQLITISNTACFRFNVSATPLETVIIRLATVTLPVTASLTATVRVVAKGTIQFVFAPVATVLTLQVGQAVETQSLYTVKRQSRRNSLTAGYIFRDIFGETD